MVSILSRPQTVKRIIIPRVKVAMKTYDWKSDFTIVMLKENHIYFIYIYNMTEFHLETENFHPCYPPRGHSRQSCQLGCIRLFTGLVARFHLDYDLIQELQSKWNDMKWWDLDIFYTKCS